ncbi:AfaD family invasin [Aeromonas salmonicida]|uniref:AfaD family invasin n=1 Tax=Aeromonas salmonicida TaxID=645 RepID=UPI00285F05DF|nr:AfaD family invasin [Aeromonas salmonicida]MDR7019089.1 hypothetical protein [Aeromonas salmonicida]
MKKTHATKRILFLILFFVSFGAYSSDMVVLTFNSVGNLASGYKPDSYVIYKGQMSYPYPHTGFHLSESNIQPGVNKNTFFIQGKGNKSNRLKVRIEYEDSSSVRTTQQGIILQTADNNVTFNIVTDGEQFINSDTYTLRLNAVALLD